MFDNIENIHSISIVGLARGIGKTTTMNWLIDNLYRYRHLGVTSIGFEGKSDVKNSIVTPIYSDMLFTTDETLYTKCNVCSEIVNIGEATATGRLITAKAHIDGDVLLSGPSTVFGLKRLISFYQENKADLAIVDGASSKISNCSPLITDGMILVTGAELSANMNDVIKKTAYFVQLTKLPKYDKECDINMGSGIFYDIPKLYNGISIYVQGAITDKLVNKLISQNLMIDLIVDDFTKVFLTPDCLCRVLKSKIKIHVKQCCNLLGITVNPISSFGYILDSYELCSRLSNITGYNVIDVKKQNASIC